MIKTVLKGLQTIENAQKTNMNIHATAYSFQSLTAFWFERSVTLLTVHRSFPFSLAISEHF
jgi:hypothetical protein